MQCSWTGDADGVQEALLAGAQVDQIQGGDLGGGRAALHHAAHAGNLDVVQILLYCNADVNIQSKMPQDHGARPLHLATWAMQQEVMKELLAAGAHFHAADNCGRTPLHWAAARGQQTLLELLISYGCDLHARAHGKTSALHYAAAYGDLDLVKWLVQKGLNISLRDKTNLMAREVAQQYGHHDVHLYLTEQTLKNIGMSTRV